LKFRVFPWIGLTLLLIGIVTLAFNVQSVKAESKTWTVDDDGPADFSSIQAAINAASSGDTVFVRSGIYSETLTIAKAISLIGENRDFTIIDGSEGPGSQALYINSNGVLVTGFTVQNGTHSNIMIVSDDNKIIGNRIANNTWMGGVYVQYGAQNIIQDNIFCNNRQGIYLYWYTSINNLVINNSIMNSQSYGIEIWYSKNNTISGNVLKSNYEGIRLSWEAVNNSIFENTLWDNYVGVSLSCDIGDESSDNSFYHNNFLDNTNQVTSFNSISTWDDGYPSGGNYWSDYTGVDADGDGIGDTPYIVDGDSQDNYPLKGMFSNYSVSYQEDAYDVTIICNSTVSGFHFNYAEGTIDFDVAGVDSTAGFCRIMIPRALIESPYTILVDGQEVAYTELSLSNSALAFLYFTYSHSTHHVKIMATPPPPAPPPVGGTTIAIESKHLSLWIASTILMMSLVVASNIYLERKKSEKE